MQKYKLRIATMLLVSVAALMQTAHNAHFLNNAAFAARSPLAISINANRASAGLHLNALITAITAHAENGLMMSFGLIALVAARRHNKHNDSE